MATETVMEVDKSEGSRVLGWIVGGWIAACSVAFLFVGFWTFIGLFPLLVFILPAAYYYFRREERKAEEVETAPQAILPATEVRIEMDEDEEVTAPDASGRVDNLSFLIKSATDDHDWDRVIALATRARRTT